MENNWDGYKQRNSYIKKVRKVPCTILFAGDAGNVLFMRSSVTNILFISFTYLSIINLFFCPTMPYLTALSAIVLHHIALHGIALPPSLPLSPSDPSSLTWSNLRSVFLLGGFKGFARGLIPSAVRSVPACASMFATGEKRGHHREKELEGRRERGVLIRIEEKEMDRGGGKESQRGL